MMINVAQLIIFPSLLKQTKATATIFSTLSAVESSLGKKELDVLDVCIIKTKNEEKMRIENGIFNERVLRIVMIEHLERY